MTDYRRIDYLLEEHPLPWTKEFVANEGTNFLDKNGRWVATINSFSSLEEILPLLLGFYVANKSKVVSKEDQVGFLKADIGTLKQLINLVGEDDIINVMSLKSRLEQVEKELADLEGRNHD